MPGSWGCQRTTAPPVIGQLSERRPVIGPHLADQFAAELDDEKVHGVLQHHGAEALEEAGDALLLEDGGEAVSDPLVPGEDGRHLNAAVQVVDDAPRALMV